MCVHGYVYVGDETVWFEFCGLPVSQFSIFCSIFMPFCFIKLLNVYGPYIFVSAVWSMCFIIGEILTREDCVCVCVYCVLLNCCPNQLKHSLVLEENVIVVIIKLL